MLHSRHRSNWILVVGLLAGTWGLTGVALADPRELATPEAAWKSLLTAMQKRDERRIRGFTTPDGWGSLVRKTPSAQRLNRFESLGKSWTKWELRWKKRSAHTAEAHLGPEAKEAYLRFKRTPQGWKLDRWQPGD